LRISAFAIALTLTLSPIAAFAEEDVAAASAAFAEAQRAQLRGDYSRAAEFFEVAYQAAPSPAALRSAIRNRDQSGQTVRAATLALRALEKYPSDQETRQLAESVLASSTSRLARVRVRCSEPCLIMADGGLVSETPSENVEFFVSTGPHTLEAQWSGRPSVSRPIDGAPGAILSFDLTAPPAPSEPASPPPPQQDSVVLTGPGAAPPAAEQPRSSSGGGLPPAVFWVGTGLTVIAGGVLTWSGLDTLSKRDDYAANPTRERYDEGVGLERRTNILAAVTGGLGISTLAIGLFATDWGGEASVSTTPSGGVAFSVGGKLP
jgi:hypothetical protein